MIADKIVVVQEKETLWVVYRIAENKYETRLGVVSDARITNYDEPYYIARGSFCNYSSKSNKDGFEVLEDAVDSLVSQYYYHWAKSKNLKVTKPKNRLTF